MNYNDYELSNLTADQQLSMSAAFPVLMRKVYTWMTLALVITGFTSYGVATSPAILQAIYGNQILFWGMIIAEFALVVGVSGAINRLSLTTATLMFILYSVINGALLSYIFLMYRVLTHLLTPHILHDVVGESRSDGIRRRRTPLQHVR